LIGVVVFVAISRLWWYVGYLKLLRYQFDNY
jgi:hypothetical protein